MRHRLRGRAQAAAHQHVQVTGLRVHARPRPQVHPPRVPRVRGCQVGQSHADGSPAHRVAPVAGGVPETVASARRDPVRDAQRQGRGRRGGSRLSGAARRSPRGRRRGGEERGRGGTEPGRGWTEQPRHVRHRAHDRYGARR